MITAAAPIASEVIDFLKIAACCPIIEGYGQTESTGGSFSTKSVDPKSGHVGGPLVNTEFKVIMQIIHSKYNRWWMLLRWDTPQKTLMKMGI